MRITLTESETVGTLLKNLTGKTLSSPISGITTDSRDCHVGDLYIALGGEHSDGHDFIPQALEKGAIASVVKHEVQAATGMDFICVTDPLLFIGDLAHNWRKQFDIPVVGITGSNGKTSTKELLKHIFSAQHNVHATIGNFNTSIGLSLTILEMNFEHTISFIEMGANQPGDIAHLCAIAEPTHGLITNIAPAHMKGFGTIAEVAKTKQALFAALTDGVSFVNTADKYIKNFAIPGKKVTFGLTQECDFPADFHLELDGTVTVTIDSQEIPTGSHNLSYIKNIIAASVVAIHLGIDWKTFNTQIRTFQPPKGRCEVKQVRNVTIIDDTYNANLKSTIAAIDYLNALSGNGRRVFVFGDMFELGAESSGHHHQVGEHCAAMHLDAVFSTGDQTIITDQAIGNKIFHKHFESKNDLALVLKEYAMDGDKILVKGSRGMSMETIIEELTAH